MGIAGVDFWPSGGQVCHVQPVTDVSIVGGLIGDSYAYLVDNGVIVGHYAVADHRIAIPLTDLNDALLRQLAIKLVVNGELSDGYVLFLPRTESVEFNISRGIGADGAETGGATFKSTDYVDVSNVRELVVSGEQPAGLSVLYGYDVNRVPVVRILGNGTFMDYHLIPTGGYVYIRASSKAAAEHSLLLYYRDRRRS